MTRNGDAAEQKVNLMPNENFKLRLHHVDNVYDYKFRKNDAILTWEHWRENGYTKKEYKRNLVCLETVSNLPNDIVIEITRFDDFICKDCTRKDSRRKMPCCSKPDSNDNLDELLCDYERYGGNMGLIMGIDVGDIYTAEELFELMKAYKKIEEKLPEIEKRIRDRGEHTFVPQVRLELIKDGWVPADYYSAKVK